MEYRILAPVHLVGIKAIAKAFRVGVDTVYAWIEQGMPHAKTSGGRVDAEYNAVQTWREKRQREGWCNECEQL